MSYAHLIYYDTPEEYLAHFERIYCSEPITTFDGIKVRFRKSRFMHDFYESSSRRNPKKDIFSQARAQRIDWIKKVLQDPNADLFQGWDKNRKRYDAQCRVALVADEYIVVVRLTSSKKAVFVTAYVPSDQPTGRQVNSTLAKIKSGPKWERKNR